MKIFYDASFACLMLSLSKYCSLTYSTDVHFELQLQTLCVIQTLQKPLLDDPHPTQCDFPVNPNRIGTADGRQRTVVRLNRPFNGVLHIVLEALQQQFHFDVTVWVMLTRILKFLTYISDAVREMPNLCKTNCSMASNFFSAVAELSHCYRRLPWWCPLPSEFRFRFRWFWGSWRRKQLLWAYWICFFWEQR